MSDFWRGLDGEKSEEVSENLIDVGEFGLIAVSPLRGWDRRAGCRGRAGHIDGGRGKTERWRCRRARFWRLLRLACRGACDRWAPVRLL